MKLLITGAAGFIGFHLAKRLLERGDEIIGIDNLNHYYDPSLKKARLQQLAQYPHFTFHEIDITHIAALDHLVKTEKFDAIVHLAAQAGVRYSLTNPDAYTQSNLVGFSNILETCRHNAIAHLIFASSSSVYGNSDAAPFAETMSVDHPISLYAATKKSNELLAHSYAHLYQLPCTGLRFFTVYGPWGRPDMAYFKFTQEILAGKSIDIYHEGNLYRDFTYIDDITDGILRVISGQHSKDRTHQAPYEIYNIGNDQPVKLLEFIQILEDTLGQKAQKNYLPLQPGDVLMTHANISKIKNDLGYQPRTSLKQGLAHFVKWYRDYFDYPVI